MRRVLGGRVKTLHPRVHAGLIGIDVVNSTGDQFSLLCEALPGEVISAR
jgi:AICAR transformylase/IMP cyclohydrolase PurH